MERKINMPTINTYLSVWITLLILTGITVLFSKINLGGMNLFVALLIAGGKGFLVALYFMHLGYERMVFRLMAGFVLITLAVIIGLTFFDTALR